MVRGPPYLIQLHKNDLCFVVQVALFLVVLVLLVLLWDKAWTDAWFTKASFEAHASQLAIGLSSRDGVSEKATQLKMCSTAVLCLS